MNFSEQIESLEDALVALARQPMPLLEWGAIRKPILRVIKALIEHQSEVTRLEAMLLDGDCARCETCRSVWDVNELTNVGPDDLFCPNCLKDAKQSDAYEASADRNIDRLYRESRS